jgi:hypothetical protein
MPDMSFTSPDRPLMVELKMPMLLLKPSMPVLRMLDIASIPPLKLLALALKLPMSAVKDPYVELTSPLSVLRSELILSTKDLMCSPSA